jgi:hypothetical protein
MLCFAKFTQNNQLEVLPNNCVDNHKKTIRNKEKTQMQYK